MNLCSDKNDVLVSLFSLATYDEGKIERLYMEIKTKILEPKILDRSQVISLINESLKCSDKYYPSYEFLVGRINENNTYSVSYYLETYLRVHTRGSCKLQNLEPYF